MRPLTLIGLGLIAIGLILVIASVISGLEGGETSTGFVGCVVIFFIPICFGGGETPPSMVLIAAIISFVVFLVFFIALIKLTRKTGSQADVLPYFSPD